MSVAALDSHPVPACVQAARSAFGSLATSAWDGLDPVEVRRLVGELSRLEAQVSAHKMAAARVLDQARKAAQGSGGSPRPNGAGTSTGSTISLDFGGDRGGADALVNTANRIEEHTTLTEAALAAGEISTKQADLISRALASLPADVTDAQRLLCEKTLLKDAHRLTLKDLRLRGLRITDAYRKTTPEVDEDEDELLRRKEEAARAKTSFSMWDNRDGTVSGRFTLPEAQGAMLKTALDALAAPHQKVGTVNAATGEHDEVGFGQSYPQRLGHAFATLVEHLLADQLPTNGGVSAVVTVNLDYETLMGGLKAAGLSDGTRISAEEARRLACSAQIVPSSSMGHPSPSTSGPRTGSSTGPRGGRWRSATAGARPRVATGTPAGPRPTTSPPGPSARGPTSATGHSCAPSTTTASTTSTGSGGSAPTMGWSSGSSLAPVRGSETSAGDPRHPRLRHPGLMVRAGRMPSRR